VSHVSNVVSFSSQRQAAELCTQRIQSRGLGHLSLLPQAVDAHSVVCGAAEAPTGSEGIRRDPKGSEGQGMAQDGKGPSGAEGVVLQFTVDKLILFLLLQR